MVGNYSLFCVPSTQSEYYPTQILLVVLEFALYRGSEIGCSQISLDQACQHVTVTLAGNSHV